MYIDKATTFNEKEIALRKLHKLCEKHKVNLHRLVSDCTLNINYADKVQSKATSNAMYEADKAKSRRSLIIEMLRQNIHSKDSIAEVLSEVYEIADFKTNKKAVAGTLYDLQTNKAYFDYKVCKDDRLSCNFNVTV